MKYRRSSLLLLLLGSITASMGAEQKNRPASQYLWYDKPANVEKSQHEKLSSENSFGAAANVKANVWESEALPIGNGRIGAMVFGGNQVERIALNEISLWSGGGYDGEGYSYGPECGENEMGAYQPFGDILINSHGMESEYTNHHRSLSLSDGISRTTYSQNGTDYTREVFATAADQVIVINGTASKKGTLDAVFQFKPCHTVKITAQGNTLVMSGTLKNGRMFEAKAVLLANGGAVTADGGTKDVPVTYVDRLPVVGEKDLPSLKLAGADSYTLLISMATDYAMDFEKKYKGAPPDKLNEKYLSHATQLSYDKLKARHLKNHQSLFNRVTVDFGTTDPATAQLPTDKRIAEYKKSKSDPDLEETLFQYGRYTLMSSSRPGSLPANLQGLWNNNVFPEWASDYHSNINLQMNYWGAETANLSECQLPLIDFFREMAEPARIASQKAFKTPDGKPVRGWTVRTSQNPFGGNSWQWNIPASAWYAHHMWDHYAFTLDKNYLEKTAYPMMKEISEFWEDHLKELGEGGKGLQTDGKEVDIAQFPELKDIKAGTLVAPNGWSPEHGPREDGVSHDQQLIWDLFTNTITAANILGKDQTWAKNLAAKRDKLAGPKIGKEGNLQEWMIDRIAKTDHRHTSHLYAVYPGNQISKEKTPELAQAARNSLEWRGTTGDSRRSWTWPWRTALWARFHEGDRAHDMVSGMIEFNLLNNMLATHPPMQMDGTFGITGGISEMLLQSHAGEIALLPAPTKAWPDGSVKGLKARGNVTVDFSWKDGKVTDYKLTSPSQRPVKVRINGELKDITPSPAARKGN